MNQSGTSDENLAIQAKRSVSIPAQGPIAIPMTNDYLFRALLQRNNNVLKGLISALLHLSPADISSVVITNPVELGKKVDAKDFILDIKVVMNDYTIINLEMQVINEHNWTDRSLSYLCRSFDHLEEREPYTAARPVIQIGLLNFTLFPDHPEFYATYQFLIVKNYTLYSDKLRLSVLNLTHTDLATEEDKHYQIDYWASLFKSTTWEELKMLAENNEYIRQASETVYQLTQEEAIRQQCEAREDYYRRQRGLTDTIDSQADTIKEQAGTIKEQAGTIKEQADTIEEQAGTIEEQAGTINQLSAENAALKDTLASFQKELNSLKQQVTNLSSSNK